MTTPRVNLINQLRVLNHAAPEEFEAFVRAFEYFTDEITLGVLAANATEILVAQGCARQLHSLSQIIEDSKHDPINAAHPKP